jgi:hypothetical protein
MFDFSDYGRLHKLNMELGLQNLFGLLCTAVLIGGGGPNSEFGRFEKKPSTLSALWYGPSISVQITLLQLT